MDQVDAKNLVGVVSDKNLGELLEKVLNVGLGFIGGKAVVSAGRGQCGWCMGLGG